MKLTELVRTSNLADIALIKSLLDSEDISYLAQGENFHMVQPLIEPVRFLVAAEDLDRAKPLIDAMQLSFSPLAGMPGSDGSTREDA